MTGGGENLGAYYRSILDSLPVLCAHVSGSGRYRFTNKRYDDWFGVQRDEIEGKTVREVIGDKGFEKLEPYLKTAVNGREQVFLEEVKFRHTDALHDVLVNYKPFENDGFIAMVQHVGDIVGILREKLDNRQKSTLHDIKNMLNPMLGYLDFLKDQPGQNAFLHNAHHAMSACMEALQDVKDSIPTHVAPATEAMREMNGIIAYFEHTQPAIRFIVDLEFDARNIRFGNLAVSRILANLLNNAIVHAWPDDPDEKMVTATGRAGAEIYRLTVQDNGAGFASGSVDGNETGGDGMGLPSVRRMCEMLGWSVEFGKSASGGASIEMGMPFID